MKISEKTFYNKVLGCFMGKNIGGTLGTPVEFKRQINDFTFYTHDVDGKPLPNDDLDLQLIWLKCVEENGPKINAQDLGEYWLDYQVANFSEYGRAKSNMRAGFMPPLSGTIGNEFKDSNGAFIRSEVWACMCPGRPDLAAQYCFEDGCVDHGNGEGTYAAIFCGAMEAAAFVESDFKKLIKIGLSYIPQDCGVAQAIKTAEEAYEKGLDWVECRDEILEKHRGGAFFGYVEEMVSKRDIEKGFHKGVVGYDVPCNMAIIVAGMLYGEGDFDKTLCITVNMGEDTDCTAGTVASIFGIIYGYEKIPEKWIKPIGHTIETICCNWAHTPKFPKTVEELTERIIKQAKIFSLFYDDKNEMKTIDLFSDVDDLSDYDEKKLYLQNLWGYKRFEGLRCFNGPRYDNCRFSVALDYEKPYLLPEDETKITLIITPTAYNEPFNLKFEFISNDLDIKPQDTYLIPVSQRLMTPITKFEFTVSSDFPMAKYQGIIRLSVEGRHTQMLVPVVLHSCGENKGIITIK